MKKKTYYHIILDQSGSMQDILKPTISGFNEQLQMIRNLQQRFPEQEILLGLTRFNDEVMHTYSAQNPQLVADMTKALYRPSGCTALFDAIGESIFTLQESLRAELVSEDAAVVVVILTDGYENASRRFTLYQIQGLIKELEATGKWTFSYLGATLDAVEIARSMNIKQHNSMSFHKSAIMDTFGSLNESMDAFLLHRRKGESPFGFLKPKK
jgi:hypothetical protein